jgi:hypothetical protein
MFYYFKIPHFKKGLKSIHGIPIKFLKKFYEEETAKENHFNQLFSRVIRFCFSYSDIHNRYFFEQNESPGFNRVVIL